MDKNCTNWEGFWNSSIGKILLTAEKQALAASWQRLTGKYVLILGNRKQTSLLSKNRFTHSLLLTENCSEIKEIWAQPVQILYGSHKSLPISPNSADCILLPHTLEWHSNPEVILREIEIALAPEGELIIFGINPISLCGLRCLFSRHRMPWQQIFQNAIFIENWLKAIGFKVKAKKKLLYRFPVKDKSHFSKLKFLTWIANFFISFFGGVYMLSVKKEVLGVTPLRIIWQKIPKLVTGHYPQPAKTETHYESPR